MALQVLGTLAADSERLGRFLTLTGLDPTTIREAASAPGFLACVMDYVAADEPLLLAIAQEIGLTPERLAAAHARLSPTSEWSA